MDDRRDEPNTENGGQNRNALIAASPQTGLAASAPVPVKVDDLPTKVLLSASYHSIDNGPPIPQPPPGEGYFTFLEFGVLHYYRTSYFDKGLVTGQFEQALTIGPGETVEIAVEITKRTTVEEENETTFSSTDKDERSASATNEFTDRISTVIQKTSSSSASVTAGGAVGVFSASASLSKTYTDSRTDSRESTRRTVKEATQRVSREISKSQVLRTRRTDEVTSRDFSRRVITNDTPDPRHFGLRRLQKRFQASTQLRGPRLVWQCPVYDPGRRLGRPRVITEDLLPPALLQYGVRELTQVDSTARVTYELNKPFAYEIAMRIPTRYQYVASQFINGAKDVVFSQGGLNSAGQPWRVWFYIRISVTRIDPKSPDTIWQMFEISNGTIEGTPPVTKFTVEIPTFSMIYVSTDMEALEASTKKVLTEFLPKYRALLTDRSSLKVRPAGDLRREERDEVLSRCFEKLNLVDTSSSPEDVKRMNRWLDLEGTFYQLIPPFVQSSRLPLQDLGNLPSTRQYDTFSDLEPAPLGSSVGWIIQHDGDARRNEFINSALANVCIPINKAFEDDLAAFLADRLGAQVSAPATSFINELKPRWAKEKEADVKNIKEGDVPAGAISPDVDWKTAPDTKLASALWPVVDVFETNEPTQGFVYQPIQLP
jgi:hypothetical protein